MHDPRLPDVGTRVTVISVYRNQLVRGEVVYITETPLDPPDTIAFTVKLRPSDYGHWAATPDEKINIFSLDPGFVEGVGWCRGWDGPAVEALKVAEALA